MITKSENFTAEANNLYYIDAAGEITVTLPDPGTVADESRIGMILKNPYPVHISGTVGGSSTCAATKKDEFFSVIACSGLWYPLFSNRAYLGDASINSPLDINFKTVGTTDLYTVPAGKFLLLDYWVWFVSNGTSGTDPSWSVGTNSSSFNNLVSYSGALQDTSTSQYYTQRWTNRNNSVAGGATIKLNVTSAGSKSACTGKLLLFGTLI